MKIDSYVIVCLFIVSAMRWFAFQVLFYFIFFSIFNDDYTEALELAQVCAGEEVVGLHEGQRVSRRGKLKLVLKTISSLIRVFKGALPGT